MFESAGWIGRLKSMAGKVDAARQRLTDLHATYARRRRAAVGRIRLACLRLTRPHLARSLEKTGIGGVADPSNIKCLHAHAAYHLVEGNHPFFTTFPDLIEPLSDCRLCDGPAKQIKTFSAGRYAV